MKYANKIRGQNEHSTNKSKKEIIMKNIAALFLFIAISVLTVLPVSSVRAEQDKLPAPQLVTDAWMLLIGYEADAEALKEILPKGLKPHPNNRVVLNMYTVPDGSNTSGFGSYTLTYVTIEVEGHDSYIMNAPSGFPGRYFAYYFNSSPLMREYTKAIGIPAQDGFTTTVVKDGKLTATLTVDGKPFIVSTADVGSKFEGVIGGHLNYFGLLDVGQSQEVVKYPIPLVGYPVKTENPTVTFEMPEDNPLYKLKPKKIDWAVWLQASFVYPQYQVLSELKAAD